MHRLFLHLDPRRRPQRTLYESLRRRIVDGELKPGERLPATRAMAQELAVSRNAVVAAYRQLLHEGYVRARVGSGTWISHHLPDAYMTASPVRRVPTRGACAEPSLSEIARHAMAVDPVRRERRHPCNARGRIAFSLESTLADPLSAEVWSRLVREQMQGMPDGYGAPAGCTELRRVLAEHLRRSRGIVADPEQVVVVAGAQQGIDLIARALLQPGSGVLIEEPGFRSARWAFEALGARLAPCPVDGEGIDVAAGGDPAARLAFVTPSHQFPTGEVMSLARRRRLLAWARATNAIVVEDDYEGEFRFEGRPLPAIHALDDEARVAYVGSFSRILYPDLRLGYMVLPPSLVEPVVALKRLADWFTPVTLQRALAAFLRGGHYQGHLRRLQRQMRERRRALLAALEGELGDAVEVTGAAGGLHVALWFRDLGPEAEEILLANARDLGVEVDPVSPFYLTAPSRLGVLLGFSRLDDGEIREGVRRLAMVWRATRQAVVEPARRVSV